MLNFRVYAAKAKQMLSAIFASLYRYCIQPEKEQPQLHYWSAMGNVPTIKHLLENEGADVNETYSAEGNNSETPLFLAVQRGRKKAIETLLSFGGIDSHDIKIIGHCLGLRGNIILKGKKQNYAISYESSSETYTLPAITRHIALFNQIVQQKRNSPHVYAVFNLAEQFAMQTVTECFQIYIESAKDFHLKSAKRYQQGYPIIIRCHWPNHVGFAVLYKDRLLISDKGINLTPGITCYQINADKLMRMSEVDLANLIGKLSITRYSLMSTRLSLSGFSELNPQYLYSKRIKRQKQLNCSYTNLKRGVEVLLMALNEDEKIDVDKMYQAFSRFDRFQTVDEHIEKYRHSPNKQAFEPLLKYLADKTIFKNDLKVALAKYILIKLRSEPINMTDHDIATAILGIPYSRPILWDLYSWSVNLENAIFQKDHRLEYFSRLLTVVPSIRAHRRIETLQAAKMHKEGLAILNHQPSFRHERPF
ncbi:MAG: ankyrin repeat domain-containing protein [Gammaproteobacteria bacterium]|nr:ankyrin repeat domain-containing protein [Gammaproteobacteria bacterium]